MAHPLSEINNFTYDSLNRELELSVDEKRSFEVLLKAYFDDFWQSGQGSLLPPAIGAQQSVLDTLFEKRFVFRNVIRECVERVSRAFFGKSPNWKFEISGEQLIDDTEEGSGELDEIDKALGQFWTSQNAGEVMSRAFESRLVFGRGGVRVFIPVKFKRQNAVSVSNEPNVDNQLETKDFLQFESIIDAIRAMRIEFVPPTQGKLLDDGGELFSIIKYKVRDDWETKKDVDIIEFSLVDNADQTFVGTLKENGGVSKLIEADISSPFDLNGHTTFNEFQGQPFVTQALYKNNQLCNLALTCAGFSLVDNGFGEMVLTNVELEMESVINGNGEPVEVPKRIKRGGGAVQNFVGIEQQDDATGATSRLSPGVHFREPTQITSFKGGFDLAYLACLQEAGQMYALISGDATASGESRIQALSDFILKIGKYKSEVDEQGSWLLTVILRWAAALANKSDQFKDTSVMFDSKMHVASLSTEEKNTVMTMRDKSILSLSSARVLLGVDDPGLEDELVLVEQRGDPLIGTTTDDLSEKLDVALKMSGMLPTDVILEYLGFDKTKVAEIKRIMAEEQAPLLEAVRAAQEQADNQTTNITDDTTPQNGFRANV